MKYLLIAVLIDAGGETSALYPPTWYDDAAACEERGEGFRHWALEESEPGAQAAYFDCLGLTPLEIRIMDDMIPYKMPQLPQ